jgi:hypothetical protein
MITLQASSAALTLPPLGSMAFAPVSAHCREISWDAAEKIHHPGTNLVIIERARPDYPESIRELLGTAADAELTLHRGLDTRLVHETIRAKLGLAAPDAAAFYADVQRTAERFLALAKARTIAVRLEKISNDNCRLFHVDHVTLRLISTYRGLATEWLRNEDVRRSGLGKGSDELVKKPGARVQRFEPGWIGILKGERYLGNRGRAIVHRSPSIAGKGTSRLLLRIDVVA